MKRLKAILVDDEESSLSALSEKLIRHCPQVEILQLCRRAEEAILAIESKLPDIVFLDIEMPVMNGFSLLQQLSNKRFDVIFVTAYDHYAIKAIRYSALDYLLKPVEIDDLKAAVERVQEKKESADSNQRLELLLDNISSEKKRFKRLAIPTSEGLQFIRTEDIIYLEASVNYTNLHLVHRIKYTVSRTLKDFEEMLPADIFLRIHSSYIINKNYVEKYIRGEGGKVVLSDQTVLDVSKRKKHEFLKSIGY